LIKCGVGPVAVERAALRVQTENPEQTIERMFRRGLAGRDAAALRARTFAVAQAHSVHLAVI
jgi:hypothetical protein